jgi:hypothetical protein
MATQRSISPEAMDRYRALVANLEIGQEQKDDVIHVVHGIMQSFIDISFGNDSAQISRGKSLSDSFRANADCDNLTANRIDKHDSGSSSFPRLNLES